jgi:hypothetical protein
VNATGPWEIRLARRSSLQAVLGLGGSTVGPGEYQCQGPAGWELTTPRTDDTAVFSCDDDNAVLWLRLDADAQTWRIDGTGDRFSETPVTAMIYDSQGGVAAVGGAGRTGGGVPEETYGPGLAAGVYAVAVVGGPWTMSISGVAEGGGPGGVATP